MTVDPRTASITTDPALSLLRAGDCVGERFRLEEILGMGGMGVVWRAHDEALGKTIALKFLATRLAHDEVAVVELKDELARCQELTHPHIIRVHDLVEDRVRKLVGISMELAAGGTVSRRRLERPHRWFEPAEIATWVQQLCDALAYAHEEIRIVHRDLKPDNLLLDQRDRLRVADFGISRRMTESLMRITRDSVAGTLCYMSPEQAQGRPAHPSDDLYAVGATLYELLTSKPPFWNGNVVMQLLQAKPMSIADRRRELGRVDAPVPAIWEEVIGSLLAKAVEDRPESIRDVAAALKLPSLSVPRGSATRAQTIAITALTHLPPPSAHQPSQIAPNLTMNGANAPYQLTTRIGPATEADTEMEPTRRTSERAEDPSLEKLWWTVAAFGVVLVWVLFQVSPDVRYQLARLTADFRLPPPWVTTRPAPPVAGTPMPRSAVKTTPQATVVRRSVGKAASGPVSQIIAKITVPTEVMSGGELILIERGTPVQVVSTQGSDVEVRFAGGTVLIPVSNTDLAPGQTPRASTK